MSKGENGIPLLSVGFRPFFLLAFGQAALYLPIWLLILTGRLKAPAVGAVNWHAHELIFGFAFAVIAGFLLTAVQNWTKRSTLTGLPLAGLALLWIGSRIAMLSPYSKAAAVFDALFALVLFAAIARPLILAGNRRNYGVLAIVGLLGLLGGLWHLRPATAPAIARLALQVIVLLILVIGMRVIPFFTRRAIPGAEPVQIGWLQWTTILAYLGMMLSAGLPVLATLFGCLAVICLVLQVRGWWHSGIPELPILWVLYSGFLWILIGVLLRVTGILGMTPPRLWLHAFAVGGLGVMTLGMMSRVALGHTGRPLQASRPIVLAYLAVNVACASRLIADCVHSNYTFFLHLAAGLWMIAYLIAFCVYLPILLRPRADQKVTNTSPT